MPSSFHQRVTLISFARTLVATGDNQRGRPVVPSRSFRSPFSPTIDLCSYLQRKHRLAIEPMPSISRQYHSGVEAGSVVQQAASADRVCQGVLSSLVRAAIFPKMGPRSISDCHPVGIAMTTAWKLILLSLERTRGSLLVRMPLETTLRRFHTSRHLRRYSSLHPLGAGRRKASWWPPNRNRRLPILGSKRC